MGLCVKELVSELKKYDKDKKVRILFGTPLQILWIGHEDLDYCYDEGCVLITSENIEDMILNRLKIDTVSDLLWHLQFFKDELLVWHNDLDSVSTIISEVSDKVTDENKNIIEDTVFLINFCHLLG